MICKKCGYEGKNFFRLFEDRVVCPNCQVIIGVDGDKFK